MKTASFGSPASSRRRGARVAGATDRQERLAGFDQQAYSRSSVLCIGAGGLISHVAPTLARKGIGRITVLDRDIVEPSNLSRQFFYTKDLGKNKAIAMIDNLARECTAETVLVAYGATLEQAIETGIDLSCDVAVCGVDNNPGRVAASRFFRSVGIPIVFLAVSADADHGYVFVQERHGTCIGCLFPDMVNDDSFPCPGTPAIADVLQAVGSLAVYANDTLVTERRRGWNYRTVRLSDGSLDASAQVQARPGCTLCSA